MQDNSKATLITDYR